MPRITAEDKMFNIAASRRRLSRIADELSRADLAAEERIRLERERDRIEEERKRKEGATLIGAGVGAVGGFVTGGPAGAVRGAQAGAAAGGFVAEPTVERGITAAKAGYEAFAPEAAAARQLKARKATAEVEKLEGDIDVKLVKKKSAQMIAGELARASNIDPTAPDAESRYQLLLGDIKGRKDITSADKKKLIDVISGLRKEGRTVTRKLAGEQRADVRKKEGEERAAKRKVVTEAAKPGKVDTATVANWKQNLAGLRSTADKTRGEQLVEKLLSGTIDQEQVNEVTREKMREEMVKDLKKNHEDDYIVFVEELNKRPDQKSLYQRIIDFFGQDIGRPQRQAPPAEGRRPVVGIYEQTLRVDR